MPTIETCSKHRCLMVYMQPAPTQTAVIFPITVLPGEIFPRICGHNLDESTPIINSSVFSFGENLRLLFSSLYPSTTESGQSSSDQTSDIPRQDVTKLKAQGNWDKAIASLQLSTEAKEFLESAGNESETIDGKSLATANWTVIREAILERHTFSTGGPAASWGELFESDREEGPMFVWLVMAIFNWHSTIAPKKRNLQ